MDITTLGIDIAKSVFQFHGVDADGAVVVQKKLRRSAVLNWHCQRKIIFFPAHNIGIFPPLIFHGIFGSN